MRTHIRTLVLVMLLGAALPARLVIGDDQLINVVLIEHSDRAARPAAAFDMARWRVSAPALLERLEVDLGYVTGAADDAGTSLFALRVSGPLGGTATVLEAIGKTTARPSLLVVWSRADGTTCLVLMDHRAVPASTAIGQVGHLRALVARTAAARDAGATLASTYATPPTAIGSTDAGSATFDEALGWSGQEGLLHALEGSAGQVLSSMLGALTTLAPGAGWAEHNISFLQGYKDAALSSSAPGSMWRKAAQASMADIGMIANNIMRAPFSIDTSNSGWSISSNITPGGVLFDPDLIFVIEQNGPASALAEASVRAVGDSGGGEVSVDGRRLLVVRAPGSARPYQVRAGAFRFAHVDLGASDDPSPFGYARYYDSTRTANSALGVGWSLAPFSLLVDGASPPNRVTLVDWLRGSALEYVLEPEKNEGGDARHYRGVTSPLQPHLATDGSSFLLRWSAGLTCRFAARGGLRSVTDGRRRADYQWEQTTLRSITTSTGRIFFDYGTDGRLLAARSDAGASVSYEHAEFRLATVGSAGGDTVLALDEGGRVASIAGPGIEALTTVTYDRLGRMLTIDRSGEDSSFVYDDQAGSMVLRDTDGGETTQYYDGAKRLVASVGADRESLLLNYDAEGRVIQVALGSLIDHPSGGRPRFEVSKVVSPVTRRPRPKGGSTDGT